MLKKVSLKKGLELLNGRVSQVDTEWIPLLDAGGRILGRGINAPFNVPCFRKSPYDGYATKSIYISGTSEDDPVILPVRDIIPAGRLDDVLEEEGPWAVKIMTGAKVPDYFDCVVPKEWTDKGSETVAFHRGVPSGGNIIPIGEDIQEGERLLEEGMEIHWGIVSLLAQLGFSEIEVYRKPKVGVLSTGNEIIELGKPLEEGQIYNSNSYGIYSRLKSLGCEPVFLGNIEDDLERIKEGIKEALDDVDLLITTGGVSVGDYDYLLRAYEGLGIEPLFWGMKIKPGWPVLTGAFGKKIVVSLPGTPGAALVTFEKVAIPVVRGLKGEHQFEAPVYEGVLMEDFDKKSDTDRYLRVCVKKGYGPYELYLSGKQNAGVLKTMIYCNGLARLPASNQPTKKGTRLFFTFTGCDGEL